jgi:hypothetical protein
MPRAELESVNSKFTIVGATLTLSKSVAGQNNFLGLRLQIYGKVKLSLYLSN